jgi:CTP:molybdopterin cytidylyltransferase MocA
LTVAAVVLAAGGGSRFAGSGSKLRADLRGRPVLAWALEAVVDAGIEHVLVVTGAVELDDVLPEGVPSIRNHRWRDGIATSVACAIEHVRPTPVDALVVGLGDQPFVTAEAWRAVAAADRTPIAVATYDGQRRNPVRLAREIWQLLPVTGDQGARVLMAERPDLVTEIPCAGNPVDIDTEEDLAQWS